MQDLIEAVKAWPVIIQGALGSALFWIFLIVAQRVQDFTMRQASKHSRDSRKSWLVSRECKYSAFSGADAAQSAFDVATLIYRSSRFLYKALMWLCLGLITELFVPIIGVIGFMGCLYYLMKAYEVISPFKDGENFEEEHKKVISELQEMGVYPNPEKPK